MAYRLQVWSMATDNTVLRLLGVLTDLFGGSARVSKARYWAHGCFHSLHMASLHGDRFEGSIKKCNVACLAVQATDKAARLKSVASSLCISPTNMMWASTVGFFGDNKEDERRRLEFRSQEYSLKWSSVSDQPTLLDCEIDWNDSDRMHVFRQISEVLGRVCLELPVLGCADYGNRVSAFDSDVIGTLAPWPRSYPSLGERFDRLHDAMFGPREIIRSLLGALPAGSAVAIHNFDRPFSGIAVDEGIPRFPADLPALAPLLAERNDSTTPREYDPALGEYSEGSARALSYVRERQLRESNILPPLDGSRTSLPVISAPLCVLAGIEPDEMVTFTYSDSAAAAAIASEMSSSLSFIPKELPPPHRVWLAYREVAKVHAYAQSFSKLVWRVFFLPRGVPFC